ncbi:uncharacterized protein LOC124156052 [Ischnura elegans]|uniref:uncharacterized protein LOC124156052 n=1 Tax=Ischnura elegans TaxID=197161 RepID=UPI001ED87D25|nr:uncharacterized protein LOC124156052 [Ischnura elegans]
MLRSTNSQVDSSSFHCAIDAMGNEDENEMGVYIDYDTEEYQPTPEGSEEENCITSLPSPEHEGFLSAPEWDEVVEGFKVEFNIISEDALVPWTQPKKSTKKRGIRKNAEKNDLKCHKKDRHGKRKQGRPKYGERKRLKSSAFLIQ